MTTKTETAHKKTALKERAGKEANRDEQTEPEQDHPNRNGAGIGENKSRPNPGGAAGWQISRRLCLSGAGWKMGVRRAPRGVHGVCQNRQSTGVKGRKR